MSNFSNDKTNNSAEASAADIRLAAMNLLARREHSLQELRQKLSRRFADSPFLETSMERLTQENLQSNARFAYSYAQSRSDKGYGPVRICHELGQRGLSDTEVSEAMSELEMNWREAAAGVLKKKFGTAPATDLKDKARRMRFLQYRGFSSEHYHHLI